MTPADSRQLRVLHLASFVGNIGDVANHAGARWMFQQHLDFALLFTELEIREFYWKQRAFDDEFVRWANTFDLLLIGGGNYFELWVEKSATGTSIDISSVLLKQLSVPTVFYSLGVDTGQGYSSQSADRFRAFVSTVLDRDDMFMCVRNDGSSKALFEILASSDAATIPIMPDGGFFAGRALAVKSEPRSNVRIIRINLAGDMLDRRFNRGTTHREFLKELADMCVGILDSDTDLRIEVLPHIWRDLSLIAELLPLIPDRYLRGRISIGMLNPTRLGLTEFLRAYSSAVLVLGMRFHANVCPIGMNVPTRGLLNYPQVGLLYEELELQERLHDVRVPDFSRKLRAQSIADIENIDTLRVKYAGVNTRIMQDAGMVLQKMNFWMHARFD